MNNPDISDFEFEELEDFDDWNRYEAIRSDNFIQKSVWNSNLIACLDSTPSDLNPLESSAMYACEEFSECVSQDEYHRLQQHHKLARPRIIKSDFRRHFPMHWLNVFNTCSYDYMMKHIHTYYETNVTLQQRDLRSMERINASAEDVKCISMTGAMVLSQFWYKAMNIAPDLVCKLRHSYVKVRSDGTSTIKCSFSMNGTKIVKLRDNHDLAHVRAFTQAASASSHNVVCDGQGVSATVAAMAAVAPTKIRSVLKAQQDKFRLAPVEAVPVYSTLLSKIPTDNMVANTVTAKPLNEHAMWATDITYTGVLPVEASPLAEAMAMDRTEAAERYVQAAQQVQQQQSRKRGRKRKVADDWFTLAQDVYHQQVKDAHRPSPEAVQRQSLLRHQVPCWRLAALVTAGSSCRTLSHPALMSSASDFAGSAPESGAQHSIHPMNVQAQPQALLTAQLDFLCSIEMNFNREEKVESMTLNYIT